MKKVKILEMADTEVSYCGGAETVIEFESIDIDKDNYDVNPDTGKKWNHRTGISLKVAKYKGKLFFARQVYFGHGFCSCHVFVDKDFELEKTFKADGRKPPLHTYMTSPGIGLTCSKDVIVGVARDYLKEETKHYDMAKHIDAVIAKFEEALQ